MSEKGRVWVWERKDSEGVAKGKLWPFLSPEIRRESIPSKKKLMQEGTSNRCRKRASKGVPNPRTG